MATDKPRFSVTFTDDSFCKIQKYQKENNISTQSKAVAKLVEIAINKLETEDNKKNSPGAVEAASGKTDISLEESNQLLAALGLVKDGQQLSNADLAFLSHIIGLLDAWFDQSH